MLLRGLQDLRTRAAPHRGARQVVQPLARLPRAGAGLVRRELGEHVDLHIHIEILL